MLLEGISHRRQWEVVQTTQSRSHHRLSPCHRLDHLSGSLWLDCWTGDDFGALPDTLCLPF